MDEQVVDEEVIESILGHSIVSCVRGDVGAHFELDDGRTLIFIGFLGVLHPERLH